MKLTVKNNWEYRTFFLGETKIDEKQGGIAIVQFPDGVRVAAPFESAVKGHHYNDMGHDVYGTHWELIAVLNVHGQNIRVPLADLDIVEIDQTLQVAVEIPHQ